MINNEIINGKYQCPVYSHSLITPSSKMVAEKVILSIAHKMENNSEFLIVVNVKLLQLDVNTIYVFVPPIDKPDMSYYFFLIDMSCRFLNLILVVA